jgi:hypothetical protein
MPRYISKVGKWKPVQEFYVNADAQPGEDPIYKGPDRGALEQLRELGMLDENGKILDTPGTEPHQNSDMILRARQFGFDNVYKFLKEVYNYDRESAEKLADVEIAKLRPHTKQGESKLATPIQELGGGRDYSGSGKHRSGGMGEPTDVPSGALKSRV